MNANTAARTTAHLTAAAINRAGGNTGPVAVRVSGTREVGEVYTEGGSAKILVGDQALPLGGVAKLIEVELNDDGTLYIATPEAEAAAESNAIAAKAATTARKFQAKVDQTEANIAAVRTKIADVALKDMDHLVAEGLTLLVNSLAAHEGALRVYSRVAHYSKAADFSRETATEIVLNMLTTGADDSWSGRGNETKRAAFDGMRDAAREVRYMVEG